jgi:hypothetical protein
MRTIACCPTQNNCYQQPAPAADVTMGTGFTPLCTRINCYQAAPGGPAHPAETMTVPARTGFCCQTGAPAADVTVGTLFTPLCTRINCGVFTPYGG